MTTQRSDQGVGILALIGIVAGVLSLATAAYYGGVMLKNWSGYVSAPQKITESSDPEKNLNGGLRQAQKALAAGALAGKSVVGAAGSPSNALDRANNVAELADAARSALAANLDQADSDDDGDSGTDPGRPWARVAPVDPGVRTDGPAVPAPAGQAPAGQDGAGWSWADAVRPDGYYDCWVGEPDTPRDPDGRVSINSDAGGLPMDGSLADGRGRQISIGGAEPPVPDGQGWSFGAYYSVNESAPELTNGYITSDGQLLLVIDIEGEEATITCRYLEPEPEPDASSTAAGHWERTEVQLNPVGDSELPDTTASVSTSSLTFTQYGQANGKPTESVGTATWDIPPAALAPKDTFELTVRAQLNAASHEGGIANSFTMIPQTGGKWSPGASVGVNVHCGPDGICDQPSDQATGTFTYEIPTTATRGATFNMGVSALNCGGACEVRWTYTWVQ